MGLPHVVVGVLADDHDLDIVEGSVTRPWEDVSDGGTRGSVRIESYQE